MFVYADNAATTKISKKALAVMNSAYETDYGNPSSLHSLGQSAAERLFNARERIAKNLNAKSPREIYFTSGGSEADNQAILSVAENGKHKGKTHIVSSAFEHHAVLHTLKKLEKQGFEITLLDVHKNGMIDTAELEAAIKEETCLVTIMFANNEIGTIQPIKEIGRICKEKGVIFHTDAVQAAGHIPVDVQDMNIDMLSLSAHKFHGPKGVGVLYCKNGILLHNLIEGGAQERSKRAGTENLPAIIGMAEAFDEACENMQKTANYVSALRNKLIDGLSKIPHSVVNGDTKNRLPGNVNMCFEGIEGESLLLLLDMKGIAASSGSACTSGSLDPSHVLLAIGLPHEVAHGSLRLTLSEENTMEEIDYIINEVPQIVAYLKNMSPVWEALEKGEIKHVI